MGDPPVTTEHTTAPHASGALLGDVAAVEVPDAAAATNIMSQLEARVVREARRETWFIVNRTGDDLATIPIALQEPHSIRRAQVNGEVAEFSASPDMVLVRPPRTLRNGAGTIVVIHFR